MEHLQDEELVGVKRLGLGRAVGEMRPEMARERPGVSDGEGGEDSQQPDGEAAVGIKVGDELMAALGEQGESDRMAGPDLVDQQAVGRDDQRLVGERGHHHRAAHTGKGGRYRLESLIGGGRPVTQEIIVEARATGAGVVHWSEANTTQRSVELAHAHGLSAWAYTLNSEMALRGAQLIGLDDVGFHGEDGSVADAPLDAIAHSTGSATEAEDVAQEAFVRVHQQRVQRAVPDALDAVENPL